MLAVIPQTQRKQDRDAEPYYQKLVDSGQEIGGIDRCAFHELPQGT